MIRSIALIAVSIVLIDGGPAAKDSIRHILAAAGCSTAMLASSSNPLRALSSQVPPLIS